MRIFTCTPVSFDGGPAFFARDSGLLCRGLQSLGIESRAVMTGDHQADDDPSLIRVDLKSLQSSDWWRAHAVDAVILYAWGRPKFLPVAAAIHKAGIYLILNQDSAGLISPLNGLHEWARAQWIYGGQGRNLRSIAKSARRILYGLSFGMLLTDPLRALHLRCGQVIGCVSPSATQRYQRLCKLYRCHPDTRVELIPHPVEPLFRYQGEQKSARIICIGRWSDSVQKRTWLLLETINHVTKINQEVEVVIIGHVTESLLSWHQKLSITQQSRIRLAGHSGRLEIAALLASSQVFYSPSAYESFGIAAAEALCCGCSLVASRSITLPSFDWFSSDQSGSLTTDDDVAGHACAIESELDHWKRGARDPSVIANTWSKRLHAPMVARRIVELLQQESSNELSQHPAPAESDR